MKEVLVLEPVGGLSGDMLVAGLADVGIPLEAFQQALEQLGLPEVRLSLSNEQRHHIGGKRFVVDCTESGHHTHRKYSDIRTLIVNSALGDGVKDRALKIFQRLAEAEAKIHQRSVDEVTFHEVGAWDSIADVVCVSLALDMLGLTEVFVAPIPTGSGLIKTAHGTMPVPAPATLELLKGFDLLQDSLPFERTTPTGAAVVAALARPRPVPFQIKVNTIGIGIGTKQVQEVPNILRCIRGWVHEDICESYYDQDSVECSVANIDDSSPEWIGYVLERLLAAGALDAWCVSLQMKKNRPGTQLNVLHHQENRHQIHGLLFRETTTLGIRYSTWQRNVLPRENLTLQTQWGMVRGKRVMIEAHHFFSPEYEDCRSIAHRENLPLKLIYLKVEEAYRNLHGQNLA